MSVATSLREPAWSEDELPKLKFAETENVHIAEADRDAWQVSIAVAQRGDGKWTAALSCGERSYVLAPQLFTNGAPAGFSSSVAARNAARAAVKILRGLLALWRQQPGAVSELAGYHLVAEQDATAAESEELELSPLEEQGRA